MTLRSPIQKLCFAGICLACIGGYVLLAFRSYFASHLAAIPESASLQRAIGLEPSNAEYRELLGRNQVLSLQNLDDAIGNFRTAVYLNPYVAAYWLELASAY